IIVAGGSSQRLGFDKLFAELNGRPVVAHSLAAFEAAVSVRDIILVGRAERLTEYEALIRGAGFRKVVAVIPGGARRQDSVARGLERLTTAADYVAVHDAARPLVRPEEIETILQCAQIHGGASGAAPVVDTLKRVDPALVVRESVDRNHLFAVQTPQIFRRELLAQAYAAVEAAAAEVTDEISAVERLGGKVVLVPNEKPNFKITYPADLALAELVLRQRSEA
nr:2-C-methyl-D-erythritol 4-phosphate cytidylyltransferase [Chthoniobacterales bacterium]